MGILREACVGSKFTYFGLSYKAFWRPNISPNGSKVQEACQKDVERCFGVLQSLTS